MNTEKPSPNTENKEPDVQKPENRPAEKGGFENRPEPTRYGDWDVNGRCSDF